jgi:hypothetical protein
MFRLCGPKLPPVRRLKRVSVFRTAARQAALFVNRLRSRPFPGCFFNLHFLFPSAYAAPAGLLKAASRTLFPKLITGTHNALNTARPKTVTRPARSPKFFIRHPQRYTKPLLKTMFSLP